MDELEEMLENEEDQENFWKTKLHEDFLLFIFFDTMKIIWTCIWMKRKIL